MILIGILGGLAVGGAVLFLTRPLVANVGCRRRMSRSRPRSAVGASMSPRANTRVTDTILGA